MPRAKVDLDAVYYSEHPKTQRKGRRLLYINQRYERTSPMRFPGHEDVVAPRVCARKCKANVRGHKCRRHTCMDYRYCWLHLVTKKHLLIAPSRRLKSFGIPGKPLGLYAVASLKSLRTAGRDADGAPNQTDELVFDTAQRIQTNYGGERIDMDERYPDPDDKETGTYTVELADGSVYDALAAASALSYSNEVINVRDLMLKHRTKTTFKRAYAEAAKKEHGARGKANIDVANTGGGMIMFQAIRPITHGQELLWTYGTEYWDVDGLKYYLTGTGWGRRDH